MCFIVNHEDTKEFINSLNDNDIIYGWKWLRKVNNNYYSPLYNSHWRKDIKKTYDFGSSVRAVTSEYSNNFYSAYGFYFFTTKKDAENSEFKYERFSKLCKFEIRKEDIFVCSKDAKQFTSASAVFIGEEEG